MSFAPASKARLTRYDLDRFAGTTLFDAIARAACDAGCLPRKELYEAWEVARRVRRRFRGGRVVDLAGGHGLLAAILLVLDGSSPSALVVDAAPPPSTRALHDAVVRAWPKLDGRIAFAATRVADMPIVESDLVVACHACGTLADEVIARAASARARLAVLPCCHDFATCEAGPLGGWLDGALAIDVMRAVRLEDRGYRVWTQTIPADITPKNRLILGEPVAG